MGMLVNTNDAFSGLNSYDVSEMDIGTAKVVYGYTLDAGTEASSELTDTMPDEGSEGFKVLMPCAMISFRCNTSWLCGESG